MNIEFYEDQKGNRPVQEFIDDLTNRAEVNQIAVHMRELKSQGYRLQRPMSAPLRDGIHELRPGPNRILYGFNQGVAVLLHALRKKTRETSSRDIDMALKHMQEWRLR